ncbi:MAG: CopD family protein [Gallionella sp.]|nr:CopD family protein [Gallionella sp.]
MALFKFIHLLAALIWIGGMFFAYVVLRPATAETLDLPQRLRLWSSVLRLFFNWVWAAVGVILITGFYLIYLYGGITHVSRYVHIMLALGLAMMVIHGYIFFTFYVPFSLHVTKKRWEEANKPLGKMRKLVAVNFALGLLTVGIVLIGVTQI